MMPSMMPNDAINEAEKRPQTNSMTLNREKLQCPLAQPLRFHGIVVYGLLDSHIKISFF